MGTARRGVAALGILVVAAASAWSARPACACGGGVGYDVYTPFTDLATLVDYDGDGGGLTAFDGPHAFRFAFLAPILLADSADPARRDERDDLSARWRARSEWAAESDTTLARLDDGAFTAALRAGALDRAEEAARATVARALDMPAAQAQAEQAPVQRAVEFLELRPGLAAANGPLLARFFALPPTPRDTPHVSYRYDSADASRERLRAWQRTLVARVPRPVPAESLSAPLREAASLRRMSRAELATAADRLPDSPRRPSLRFVALQERTRALVPDGWPSYDTTHVEQARARELRALRGDYAAWLAAYPRHPLADLVRLSTVRVDRLLDDSAAVWRALLAEYPRHRGRVAAEMDFLLSTGYDPPATVRAAITDPLLRTALVFHAFGCASFACADGSATGYSRATWDAEWRRAAAARAAAPIPAPWAVNAQERLLRIALGDTSGPPLPPAFPARAEAPTTLWGTLRLALLVRAGRWNDAEAQAAILPDSNRAVAAFRMRLALRRHEWSRALAEPALHPDTRRYFLQVLAPDSVLAAVAGARDPDARGVAVRAQAARLAAAGDWVGAARTARPVDTALARQLGLVGTLAADRTAEGRAALARHLVAQQGELLGGADDRDWYRTVEGRWLRLIGDTSLFRSAAPAAPEGVPWTPDEERRAARRFLLGNSELYLALGAYADALRALPAPPADAARRRALARAGDVPYNRLINRNYEYTVFWRRELARDSAVAVLRRSGRAK